MALKYTGSADVLVVDGKSYRRGGGEDAAGVKYGDFDHVNISKTRAGLLAAQSRLHSFEDADGDDVIDTKAAPMMPPTTPAQAEAAKKS